MPSTFRAGRALRRTGGGFMTRAPGLPAGFGGRGLTIEGNPRPAAFEAAARILAAGTGAREGGVCCGGDRGAGIVGRQGYFEGAAGDGWGGCSVGDGDEQGYAAGRWAGLRSGECACR